MASGARDRGVTVHEYHDGTKHHFNRFAKSVGYLDWASQPRPFREYAGAPTFPLFPSPAAGTPAARAEAIRYAELFDDRVDAVDGPSAHAIGDVLRHALGLSAWKQFGRSRWSLRVNPSSGNLHPTEAYVVCGAIDGWSGAPAVYHYAPDRHAVERRCTFDAGPWLAFWDGAPGLLVALTSIHWREAWKYGERAFRYCQHDLGHAIAAVSLAARLAGWDARVLPEWPHSAVAALTGIDREADFADAEREEPGCVIALTPRGSNASGDVASLVASVQRGQWSGRGSQLSEDHVEWSFIDHAARATHDPGHLGIARPVLASAARTSLVPPVDARATLLQRRSAVAFDAVSRIARSVFVDMMGRALPGSHRPWNALWWTPRIHLAIFVHRVDDLAPGLYLLPRDPAAVARLKTACARDFLWETADTAVPLLCLARGDARALAARLSCDQEIASDGFFSLGMIADFDASLEEFGASFYRNLFWEAGLLGQVLYLEAEAAGARATGIGCYYDDPVHDVLGISGHAFQSLYHFTVGMPVEDARLTTEPGYEWEMRR